MDYYGKIISYDGPTMGNDGTLMNCQAPRVQDGSYYYYDYHLYGSYYYWPLYGYSLC